MSSTVTGYEYDIFISYRQKDNKYDGWVTEFVANLRLELEATFKEEISVYFDINPHDGLLETHDVNASLREKLNCLIFIPIISQTYCDTRSYAWQFEFCTFNSMAKEDPRGRNIKLAGGNVASRILPVKIHDLDSEDKMLLENEIGGTLRGIEFIYKSSGVNRPLRANEDHPQENLNKTYYRDQINKVANAVKEIINSTKNKDNKTDGASSQESLISQPGLLAFRKKLTGRNVVRASLVYLLAALVFWKVAAISSSLLTMPEYTLQLVTLLLIILFPFAILLAWLFERSPKGFVRTGSTSSKENPFGDEQKKPLTSITFMALLLFTAGALFFLFPQTSSNEPSTGITEVEKSIAVLPFVNDSPDQDNAYFISGMMDEILNNLQKIKDFRVLSRTSTEQFKGANKLTITEIAKKLKVNYIVEGSGQKYGNTFRLSVQLIAAGNEKHLWGDTFTKEISETKDIFNIQSQVAQTIATRLQATITPDEKRLIEKTSTINLTAYDFYRRGQDEIEKYPWPEFNPEALKRGEDLFHKALKYDSTFALAYYGLANIIWIKSDYSRNNNNVESSILKRYIDSMRILADIALSFDDHLEGPYIIRARYFSYYNNFKQAIEEYDKAIKYNPNDSWAYLWKGMQYRNIDFLKSLENFQKAASLDRGSGLPELLITIGVFYFQAGFPEKGNDFFLESLKLDGDTIKYSDLSIRLNLIEGRDYTKAIEYFEKRYLKDSTDTGIIHDLGFLYTLNGNYKESLKYFKRYLSIVKDDNLEDNGNWIGYSYLQNGYTKEADYYFNRQIHKPIESEFSVDKATSAYALAAIYACREDKAAAYKYLIIFKENLDGTSFLYSLNQLKRNPMFNSIRNEPEFQKILKDVEAKYQALHERVRKWLAEQGEKS